MDGSQLKDPTRHAYVGGPSVDGGVFRDVAEIVEWEARVPGWGNLHSRRGGGTPQVFPWRTTAQIVVVPEPQ